MNETRRLSACFVGVMAMLVSLGAVPNGSSPARHIHDPVIARDGRWYYLYSTGPGIFIHRSRDLMHWQRLGKVFKANVPQWAHKVIPGSTGVWAPSITHINGQYRLYYAVSTFGSNHSAIGLVTTPTLNPNSPKYHWHSQGIVVQSHRTGDFNAIDPYPFNGPQGQHVLAFGSFWSGIKMVNLDQATGLAVPEATLHSLAYRPGSNAIEAPCLYYHAGWYYLFLSFDYCCRGVHSTYNIRVGRARNLQGPYVDASGRPLMQGGGTPLLATQGDFIGPGHCSVLKTAHQAYLVYHYYDGAAHGVPTLQLRPLRFTAAGWPTLGKPIW